MKQKTFEFPDSFVTDFEEFCRSRMLVEKRLAAAAVFHMITAMTPEERDAALLAYQSVHGDEQVRAKRAATNPEPNRGKKPHHNRGKGSK